MIKEFAIDPEALKTWADLKYVTEKFGVDQGRFISRFPKRWAVFVEQNMKETSWRRRQQFTTRLLELKRGRKSALLSCGREYTPNEGWKENACRSHAERPFHALITSKEWPELPCAVPVDDVDENHFEVPRDMAVPRTAESLAETIAPLLAVSHEVVFVDPYFDPRKIRFRRPLLAVLGILKGTGRPLKRCEFHLKQHENPKYVHELKSFEAFTEACRKNLPRWVPRGIELTLVRWRQITNEDGSVGERLHPRYILTDIGGIHFDSGLDDGKSGETTDVRLLSDKMWARRRREFLGESPDIKPAFTTDDVDGDGNHRRVTITGTWAP